jgi:hypothetical protein
LVEFVRTRPLRDCAAALKEISPSLLGVNEVGVIGAASLIWEYHDLFAAA